MVRIAIVDDDIYFAEAVEKQTEAFFVLKGESVEIWKGCGKDLLEILEKRQNFEIYFFDVEMPEMDGVDLAEKVRAFDPGGRVILLTAYDRYALQGIRLGVYYYILKDHYEPELFRILERIYKEGEAEKEEYYFISTEVSGYRIRINDIMYLTKEKKYTIFHCLEDMLYKERDSLGNVSGRLPQDRFVTVNRGTIVNLKHILSLEKLDLTMRDGNVLPVSRYEKTRVLDKLAEYWRKTC